MPRHPPPATHLVTVTMSKASNFCSSAVARTNSFASVAGAPPVRLKPAPPRR
jgi:hypothetical protein